MIYHMKDVCKKENLKYETLKFYCNEGLIPNLQRDENNYRIFTEGDLRWVHTIGCLRDCDLSIKETKEYIKLAQQGISTVDQRVNMLKTRKQYINEEIEKLKNAIAFIEHKERYYAGVKKGNTEGEEYWKQTK